MTIEEVQEQKKEMKAQKNLNKLLGALKTAEEKLPQNIQTMTHSMQKKEEKDTIKDLLSAVKDLGDAKDAVLEAENARANLLYEWKNFLQQSVVKWTEFTTHFQASDTAHQNCIRDAKLTLRRSQKRFDQASKKDKVTPGEAQEISDEESDEMDQVDEQALPQDESTQQIHEGMNSIVTSLQSLSETADQLEHRIKRHRTGSAADSGNTANSPFGQADAK